jgi:hypothetical protein
MMMMIGQSLVLVLFVFCLPKVETHPHVLIRNPRRAYAWAKPPIYY